MIDKITEQRLKIIFNDGSDNMFINIIGTIIALLIIFFAYNALKEQPIENYKGSVVIEKNEKNKFIKVKDITKENVRHKKIFTSDYDFNRYEIGDTIK